MACSPQPSTNAFLSTLNDRQVAARGPDRDTMIDISYLMGKALPIIQLDESLV